MTLKKRVENLTKNQNVLSFPVISNVGANGEEVSEKFERVALEARVEDLLHRADEIQKECEDFTIRKVTNENVKFNLYGGLDFLDENEKGHRYNLTSHSLSQLGTKLGIPIRYLEKCVNTGNIDLAKENVDTWLDQYGKDLFIRTYRGDIRGILSSRYSVCDTDEILQVVDDKLDLSKWDVRGSFLSPERFHARFVSKEKLFGDDDLFSGFMLDSSDVGRSVLNVRFMIWKQVCTNGMVVSKGNAELFRQRHIGITSEEFARGFAEGIERIPEIAAEVAKQIERSKNKDFRVDQEVVDEIMKRLKNNTAFNEEQIRKVIYLTSEREKTVWGHINAITEVAQEMTLESRIEAEKYAGTLLVA